MKKLASLVLLGLVLVGCSNSGSGDVMTMEEASKIALEEVDGEVIKSSEDRDDGRTYYEFEIVTDSEKYDLEIDGESGDIVKKKKMMIM
ncbi:PepSY domain-containing protein [Coprobacillaceae bacterium CR2/5/TPMF4]|nr:PepSY domain-containing protein [Coprobacillaceae bacterium CR2/5/TPMF4]